MFERNYARVADRLVTHFELLLRPAVRETAGSLALKTIGVELSTSPEDLNEGLCKVLEETNCSPDDIQAAMIANEICLADAVVDPHWQEHIISTPLGNVFYF